MGDMGDTFRVWDAMKKRKKAGNLKFSTDFLLKSGIKFESRNSGVHLIIAHCSSFIDYWPSTGLWIWRKSKKRHRGINSLLTTLEKGLKKAKGEKQWMKV